MPPFRMNSLNIVKVADALQRRVRQRFLLEDCGRDDFSGCLIAMTQQRLLRYSIMRMVAAVHSAVLRGTLIAMMEERPSL